VPPVAIAAAGEDKHKSKYIRWCELLRRVFGIETICQKCQVQLRLMSLIKSEGIAMKLLTAMHLRADVPTLRPARPPRAPPGQDGDTRGAGRLHHSQGCFKDTGGSLCAQGSIAALACTSASACDWDTNWGAMIGWKSTPIEHQPWGTAATSGIAVNDSGGTAEYRPMVHVAGDPDSKVYWVENCVAGRVAVPSDFLSQCWSNSGDVLPDFGVVDTFGLQFISTRTAIDFDVCISAITLF